MTEAEAHEQAKSEAEFYTHLATFLVVTAGLTAVNLLFSPGHFWVVYVLFGWGIGLATHAAEVFGLGRGSSWQQRRAQELLDRQPDEARLRSLLDETLDARALPAGPPQDLARLQRRIEHLEAIVTATGDPADVVPPRLDLGALADAPEEGAREAPGGRRLREP